ncbi:M61 family metallopeptidase [Thiomicrorhabdus aquaedulcis]|uniref:M61 family metallopeptidase n=1 Tax=Thiomicrorhabdus aquaedulcis TaxID=2211106 RepID=UPI000FDB7E9E|nr:PDZ domain-containing protein [Thiomicrorhabdus aquaedulcis]
MKHPIHYTLCPIDPNGHLFAVSLTISHPSQPVQEVCLPNWIPGSYLIRDFSKHLINLTASDDQYHPIELVPIDKSTWHFNSDGRAVTLRYNVYAWDLSVRGAHFDCSHAFYNGTSVFLAAQGQRQAACSVELVHSEWSQKHHWKVATGMPAAQVDAQGFGLYAAQDYNALIDYPVEMGTFVEVDFIAANVPHKIVLTGVFECDTERLKADLTHICATEIALFGAPAPMENYVFQVMVTGSDYGGLEHRNSTALLCSRDELPYVGMTQATEGYLRFLELCAHEYFHTWNVKRIAPKVYLQSDLKTPAYTQQLWWFEGATSYYDALLLKRAGLVDNLGYLQILAKQMTLVYRMPGRFMQSTAHSSWFTWTKFYQQDENAPNAIISYYTKGSLLALGLDLTIRIQTQGAKSLDDVLLHLWQHYGKTAIGLEDGEIEALCSQISGLDLSEFFTLYLHGTQDLPFREWFAAVGIDFSLRPANALTDAGAHSEASGLKVSLGANLTDSGFKTVKITHVWNDQAAYHAGLSAGDEIIAINSVKITSVSQLEGLLKKAQVNAQWTCHYFRRDELRTTQITLTAPPADRVVLKVVNSAKTALWLGADDISTDNDADNQVMHDQNSASLGAD